MGDSALSQEDIDNLLGGGFEDSDSLADDNSAASSNSTSADSDAIFDGLDSLISGSEEGSSQPAPAASPSKSPAKSQGAPAIKYEEQGNLPLLLNVIINLNVELGKKSLMIKDILALGEGSIIELDKSAGDPVDIMANNRHLAKGEVVVVDEQFGVRVTEMINPLKFD